MRYRSYLLRLWATRSKRQLIWRASLEDPHTGKRQGFASLRDVFAFLEKEIGQRPRCDSGISGHEKGGDAERTQS